MLNRRTSNEAIGLWIVCVVLAVLLITAVVGWLNSYVPLATEFVPLVQAIASIATVLSLILALSAYALGVRAKRLAAEDQQKSYAQMVGVSATVQRYSSLDVDGSTAAPCPTATKWNRSANAECSHRVHTAKIEFHVQNSSPYPIHSVLVLIPENDKWERTGRGKSAAEDHKRLGSVLSGNSTLAKVSVNELVSGPGDGVLSELTVEFRDVHGSKWLSTNKGAELVEAAPAKAESARAQS